jgi:hypothetical protein
MLHQVASHAINETAQSKHTYNTQKDVAAMLTGICDPTSSLKAL